MPPLCCALGAKPPGASRLTDSRGAEDSLIGTSLIGPADWERLISDVQGPQLVVAGPGTGKTEFLVRRGRHLIESGIASPAEILILAFSRRAAGEIAGRAASPLASTSPVATTFHSFAQRILEAHGVAGLRMGADSDLADRPGTGWPGRRAVG